MKDFTEANQIIKRILGPNASIGLKSDKITIEFEGSTEKIIVGNSNANFLQHIGPYLKMLKK